MFCSSATKLGDGQWLSIGLDTNYDVLHTTKYKLVYFEMY